MERWIPATLAILALGVAGSASAQQARSPLPLADGNQWTLVDVETDVAKTIAVNRVGTSFVLSGLPGAPRSACAGPGRPCRPGTRATRAGRRCSASAPRPGELRRAPRQHVPVADVTVTLAPSGRASRTTRAARASARASPLRPSRSSPTRGSSRSRSPRASARSGSSSRRSPGLASSRLPHAA